MSPVHAHITANCSRGGFAASRCEFVEEGMATCGSTGTKTKLVYHMFFNYLLFVTGGFSFFKIQFNRASPMRLSAHIAVWPRVPETFCQA